MINELKSRLTAIGLSDEMADKAIEAMADYAKTKLPGQFHSAIDNVMAGKEPDFGPMVGLLGGLKGLFGGK